MTRQTQPERTGRTSIRHQRPPLTLVVAFGTALMIGACTVGSTSDSPDTTAAPSTVVEQTTPPESTTTTTGVETTTTQAATTTASGLPPVLAVGSGSGDDIVEFSIIDTAAAVTFTHDGTGTFSVRDLGEDLVQMDLLVNTTGPYTGTRPLQWSDSTGGFEITADGDWSYEIVPMEVSRHEYCPFSGDGDDVIIVNDYKNGGSPADIAFDGDTELAIWIWGFHGQELIVHETGPYSGTVLVEDKMITWDIAANGGTWTIDCG